MFSFDLSVKICFVFERKDEMTVPVKCQGQRHQEVCDSYELCRLRFKGLTKAFLRYLYRNVNVFTEIFLIHFIQNVKVK